MARAHVMRPITSETGDLLNGALVLVRESGVSVPVGQLLYSGPTGTDTLPNPFIASTGVMDFWIETPQRLAVLITKDGHADISVIVDAAPPPEETARTDSPLAITGDQLPGRVLLAGSTPGQVTWADPPTSSGVTPLVTVVGEDFDAGVDPSGWTFTQSAATRTYVTEVPQDEGFTYALHMTGTGNSASLVARTPGFTLTEAGYVSCWLRPNLASSEQVVIAITNNVGAKTVLETITGVRPWGFYRYPVAAGTYQSMSIEYTGAATFTGSTGHELWVTGTHAVYGGQVPVHTHAGSGANSVLLGAGAVASGTNAVALGPSSSATGSNDVAVGYSAQAAGTDSVAIGSGAQAPAASTVAVGHAATGSLSATAWTALGESSYVDLSYGTAVGSGAQVYSQWGTAIGVDSYVGSGSDSGVAIGDTSSVQALNGVAIGVSSSVNSGHSDSVVIGPYATSTGANQVVLGDPTDDFLTILLANKVYAISAVQLGSDATSRLGFFGAEGTNRPIVTGSAGGVVALQNVLGALHGMGLITNSTT